MTFPEVSMSDCIFCKNLPKVAENELAYAIFDINPLSKGHTLLISKRHVEQIFELTPSESSAMRELLHTMKERIQKEHSPDGFNIWVNCGKAAGQAVMHAHMHIIPRYKGQILKIAEHLKGNIE
jgi:diadenosine tetraphosphate (Ap4A) HIT family hydrolase